MSIIIAILIFTFLVLIHELGHFLTAKILGVRAYELSIGMGPKIFGKKYKDTEYTLRAIPFGAYVRFGDEEDSLFEEGDNFMNQRPWDRIKIIVMGPLVNIVTALMLMILVVFMTGVPVNKIGSLAPDMPAIEAGMQEGDSIIEIEGTKVKSWNDVVAAIESNSDQVISVVVERENKETAALEIRPVESDGKMMIGISPAFEKNLGQSISAGTTATLKMSTMMIDVVKQLFTGKADINSFSGPVGIVAIVDDVASTGMINLIYLTAILSLNLGILNLLPIPALDGSKILIYGFEALSGKPMNKDLEMKLTMVGFAVLMAFTVFITFKDIIRLIG
ncbi:RIP metalloprotease RseP [Proteocatella sphenisci]|uniref:RIP metalloprotease RseP n=1 Tax=Proteocatella sphenisci TaxID=181070 RepID=UPI00048B90D6|nr:RIP metalloprotease RseP [Proteocatella sphenisci]